MRETAQDVFNRVYAEAMSSESHIAEASTVKSMPRPASVVSSAAIGDASGAAMTAFGDSASVPASTEMPTDSIRWEPAVARTWVNVRSDASRGGEVVGVIKPDERAMLGVDRAGWRQVRLPDVSGWVDPRLFDADPLRTRG